MPKREEKNRIEMTEKSDASSESSETSTIWLASASYEIYHFSNAGRQEETRLPKITPNPGQNKEEIRNTSERVGRSSLCAVPTGSLPTLPQKPACPTGPKPATVTVKTRMVPDRKLPQNHPNQQQRRHLSKRPESKCPDVIPTGLSPMFPQRPLPHIPSKAPTVRSNTRKNLPVKHHMVQDKKVSSPSKSLPNSGKDIFEEDTTGRSLLKSGNDNNKCIDESQNTVFSEVFQKVSGDLYSLKMHIDFWKAKYASSVNADELVEKETQQYLQTFFERRLAESSCGILKKTSSQTTPNSGKDTLNSGKFQNMSTNDEAMQDAATMKEQLSVPVLSENPPDMTKKTSSQTLSDQTVEDLPIENNELDRTKAGQPITDSSLSTDICEDHSEDVSAGSKLESMASESEDEKPKGKIGVQKLKRAVIKRFNQRKATTSEAPDDESARQSSASPESTLTDDEATQAAANMKEQLSQPVLSENPPDMTKKTSSQTLSDQTVQDLPTEHDELDNTKAGQPMTDSSLSTDSCEDHSEDVSAGSELESMASESHDEKPKGKTPFQKFKRAVTKRFRKKKIVTGRELQSSDSESQDETPEPKTRLQKFKRAVTKRFHKKKVATSDAPEDTSNTFKTEAEGVAEDAKCILNEEIDIEVLKKQFTEVCIDVLQYIRDSSVTLSFQSNYHLPR